MTSVVKSSASPAARTSSATPRRRKISIVRAATVLHFASAGSSSDRFSTTVTSTPREARSIASVSPTGPAPMIVTCVSTVLRIPDYVFATCSNSHGQSMKGGD